MASKKKTIKIQSVTMQRRGKFSQGNRVRTFNIGETLVVDPKQIDDFQDQGNQISPVFFEILKKQKFIF